MKTARLILFVVVAAAVFGLEGQTLAQSSAADAVQQDLDAAKAGRTQAVNHAVSAMAAAFDAQIKSLTAGGDADSAKILSAQKAAFVAGGTLPQSPLMGQAVTQYQLSIKDANDQLVGAYATAIAGFDQESRPDLATQARRDRGDLLTSPAWSNAVAGGPSNAVLTPDTIAHELEAAKSQNRLAVDEAKKTLLSTIDQRVTAATDAGDLAAVEALQAVQATAAVDGTVPDNVKDASVAAAKRKYDSALVQAATQLKLAYQKAVRDYTRARQLALAQSTQSEMNSLGLSDSSAPSAMTVGTYQLGTKLPDFLVGQDAVFLPLGDRYGIIVPETQFIRTRESDLLTKNFTFDVWFYLIKDMRNYPKLPAALIGLGDGTTNIVNGGPQDSLYLEINPPDRNGGEVNLHQRQASAKTTIGHLKDFDTYVARIQKSGNSVRFIVGTEQSGTLVPEVSMTVGDVRSESPYLNDHNGHLFFGSGAFRQLSISKGPPPVTATPGAAPLAAAGSAGESPPANAKTEQTTGGETTVHGRMDQAGGVYLSDLAPTSISTFTGGAWGFGNKGRVGMGDRLISVLGAPSPHGLGTHPPSNGAAVVKYELDGSYRRITGAVAIDDAVDRGNSVLIFRIVGDGREIWRAEPIQTSRKPQQFNVDISGVKVLELIVDCPGEHTNCQAVWLEPEMFSTDRSDSRVAQSNQPGTVLDLKFSPENVDSQDSGIVRDLSALHHGAALQNVSIVKNDETGWAAEFDGKSSSVSLGNDPVYQMSGGLTIAARVKPTGPKQDKDHIVARDDWENRGTNGYVLRLWDGKPDFTIGMNGWQDIQSGDVLDRNKWHTLAGTFDGSMMKLYVDGEMVAAKVLRGRISPSKSPLVIGNGPVEDKRFEGEISEVWLANQAWPAETIAQLGNRQIASSSGRTIDLLKMIDLSRDVVSGSWQLQDGVLTSDETDSARIQLPYHPPQEYDFKVVFTPVSGNEKVTQICLARGHQFLLQIGSTHNSVYGFDGINGTGENPTVRRADNWIKNGQEYTSVIKVRKDGFQSFLDGKLISEWATDYHDMSLWKGWKLKANDVIGVGSALRSTKFKSIEITEISPGPVGTTELPAAMAPPATDPIFKDSPKELIDSMKGNYSSFVAGIYVLQADGERISTTERFKPPVAFRLTAQTDSTNIRLNYAADQIIFNWEENQDELRINGGPADRRYLAGAGRVPTKKWVTIDQVVLPDSMTIYVDGKQRYVTRANFSAVNEPFSVFEAANSVVQVRSLLVGQPK